MLTVTLRHLERDGLVQRTVHAEVPPRVEYELTRIGRTLIEPARELSRWALGSYVTILDSRERFDAASAEPKKAREATPMSSPSPPNKAAESSPIHFS
jgi:DNA-binding HxlR family transcriptional regulator